MFDDVKKLPTRIWIPPDPEEEKKVQLTPQRTKDGRLVVGYIEDFESLDQSPEV
jgi:hypothetical protein